MVVPKRFAYPSCSVARAAAVVEDDDEDAAPIAGVAVGGGISCCRRVLRTLKLKSSCLISQSSFQKAHNAHLRKMD